jgi:hypothetical protein
LRRLETERTYLEHQLRLLRKLHDGPLRASCDVLAGEGFYDVHRVQLTSPALHRAYELLYPRDARRLSPEVLAITGWPGLAALWLDQARWHSPRRASLRGRYDGQDYRAVRDWLAAAQIPTQPLLRRDGWQGLELRPPALTALLHAIAPHVHRSQRFRLRYPGRLV